MKTIATILLAGALAAAASADEIDVDAEYFHPAASLYIHGDATSASNLVVKGLSLFPEDGKLKRLKELLDQQQEQEQEQNQDNQDQQQDQDQDQQQDKDDQQDQEDQPQNEQNDQQDQPQQPEPPSAEQMSADEAEQLLAAMRQEEQNKRLQLHPVHGRPVKVDKDW